MIKTDVNAPVVDPFNEPNNNEGYYGYIYMTTDLRNGKKYIGKKKAREFLYIDYVGSGKIISNIKNKYGLSVFEVELIGWYETKDELNKAERFWIRVHDTRKPKGYNISEGGDWGDITEGMTEDEYEAWRKKISDSVAGDNNGFYGRHHSEGSKEKIRSRYYPKGEDNPNYGKARTEETRRKISEATKGREAWNKGLSLGPISEESRAKRRDIFSGEGNPFYGRHHSKESKEKMREKLLGHELSKETRNKISAKLLGTVFYNNGEKTVRISKDEISYYESLGYTKGRARKNDV